MAKADEYGVDAPYWEAARTGSLVLQHCDECSYVRWPAAGVCPECLSRESTWSPVEGAGTLWSIVTYHRAYARSGLSPVPYNVALVELDCGARLITRLVGDEAPATEPGVRVEVRFEDVADHGVVPVFVPARAG